MAKVQRVMSIAYGRQVLLSNASGELVHNELPNGVALRDLKEHRLKGLSGSEHLWQIIAPDLQQDFPPLQSLTEIPNNLPTQLTSFVGREKELAEVKRLLQDAHILTLIGPGGTGKTRLSIQSANESLTSYSDGVWLVELAPILDPLLVPRTTAIAIGLREEPQRPVIDMLCDYLREKKILILLDNCEHLVDACAQMANKILQAAPHVRILASSREALGIAGEVTYRVPSLGLPDVNHLPSFETLNQYEAVKLFIDRAVAAVSTFTVTNDNAPHLAQICHRLDGIPLAIELAAAKIRVLNVEQISKRLDDRFRLLTGGSRTALERHQTLRAAIDWSYNLLPPNEQVLFRRLSVFVGGWTLEGAESVCGEVSITLSESSSVLQSDDVLNLLEQLINKSLVIKDETQSESRYRMLETMRQYANEKLVESGKSDVLRDNHLDYFLNLAETAAPHLIQTEQLEWLAQLDADYENLRAALEWALSKETAESSLRLCAALGRYWFIRTFLLEGSKWLKNALSKTTQNSTLAEKAARVKALYEDAELANQLDDFEHMKTSAEQSFTLAQEVSDKRDTAIARYEAASVLYRCDDYEKALPLLEQCYAEFREINDPYWQLNAYKWLSQILARQGRLKYSERVMQTLELARKGGERLNLAEALFEYGGWLYRLNRFDEAIKYVEEADALFKQIGSKLNITSFAFAEFAWLNGNYKEAESYYMEMQARFGLIGEKNMRSGMIAWLGLLAMEQGNLEKAQAYFEEALATEREIDNKAYMARSLAGLGINFYLQGNIEKCRQNFKEGIFVVKPLEIYTKRYVLFLTVKYLDIQKLESIVYILGALDNSQKDDENPIEPFNKRYYNHAEARTREKLGDVAFKSAFAEGQKMSLDEALDLALKTVEEM
jgi:predicted ATPase/TolA-binding protein